ncbi:MAG TPA: hypothetical protein VMZ50_08310 [Phycisphaerae bacterium]|nr:hypothetical protein [Phycisphaerae bacterium]
MSSPASPGWCPGGGGQHRVKGVASQPKRPKARRVRCPECGRSLTEQVRPCGDIGCWHVRLPAHKTKVRRPKGPGRRQKPGRLRG